MCVKDCLCKEIASQRMHSCLVVLAFTVVSCVPQSLEERCNYLDWEQPIPVINSKYTVRDNGDICCPLHAEDSMCVSEEDMKCRCTHGLVEEPCRYCKTCARGLGEECGGVYGAIGECAKGLVCTADTDRYLNGHNDTGVCVHKEPVYNGEYEPCGGEFWERGIRCSEGLKCIRVVDEDLCVNSSVNIKQNCFKDCSARTPHKACGSDGRIYENVCFLRQQNCKGAPEIVSKMSSLESCQRVCPDITPPANGRVIFSKNGIRSGANASIVCDRGYIQFYPASSSRPSDLTSLVCDCIGTSCSWVSEKSRDQIWKPESDLPKCVKECEVPESATTPEPAQELTEKSEEQRSNEP